MNCVRCNYLLWDLDENRCPECGLPFETTDYSFQRDAVAFICPCGQSYAGNDENGLPWPRQFNCTMCENPLDAAQLRVKPLSDSAAGQPIRLGTPWERRDRVGFLRGFLDGVARLAMQPAEFFRLTSTSHNHGEIIFSVLCAYIGAGLFLAALVLLQAGGLLSGLPDIRALLPGRVGLLILAGVPLVQITWNYLYGLLIEIVLAVLGHHHPSDYESSVRAVAFGSAVLPAVMLLPPVGLLWYINVVSNGVEHMHQTTKAHALVATLIPILLAGNVLLILGYAVLA
jgi:hypothetical protein